MGKSIFFFLYNLLQYFGLFILWLGAKLSYLIPSLIKWKTLYQGRKSSWSILNSMDFGGKNVVWMHCASLGEYEQGLPVLRAIKKQFPKHLLAVSFYSPSGYEIRKNNSIADVEFYLPADTNHKISCLLDILNPKLVFMVKSEFWWNTVNQIQKRGIPLFLVSGVFTESNYFFHPLLKVCRDLLNKYDCLFVQDDQSAQVLSKNRITNVVMTGDTRVEQCLLTAQNAENDPNFTNLNLAKKTIVYGSIYLEDIHVINQCIAAFDDFVHIIVPHNVSHENIQNIKQSLSKPSTIFGKNNEVERILIVDTIGLLSKLYKVAKYAYVGGGFGKHIHNILEPAAYLIPVFYGPKHLKSLEAIHFSAFELAYPIANANQIVTKIKELEENQDSKIATGLKMYFEKHQGAVDKIMARLELVVQNFRI